MDQLRTALAWLKKQHFWVLSVLVALIGLACWWSASGKLSKLYAANQKTITDGFNSLKTLRDTPFHPNDTINERQIAETKKQAESVTKIWQQLYERQREQVLEWPAALSQKFRDQVEKLQFGADIDPALRDNYQNYVDRHFPKLPEKIGARPLQAGEGGQFGGGEARLGGPMPMMREAMPGGALLPEDDDYICEWLAADQALVRAELDFPQQPSSIRIWVTQENLWVYHTLLDVIKVTNEAAGATRMSNAAVKVVYSLDVGKRAAQYSRKPGRLAVPPAMAADAGIPMGPEGGGPPVEGGGQEGGGGPPGGFGGPEGGRFDGGFGGPGSAEMTPDQENAFLLSYRYLDDKGMPIPAGGAGAAADPSLGAEAAPVDPAAAAAPVDLTVFGQEYKRLPVRMVLQMDVRWLPQLLAACANQSLRVEPQEVRINPPDAGGPDGGMGGGGFRGGFGGPGGGSGVANLFPEQTGPQNFPSQPNVVNVVIQGIIYIFNKPNPTALQPPGEEQTTGM